MRRSLILLLALPGFLMLARCDSGWDDARLTLPTGRTVLIMGRDSAFAVSVGDPHAGTSFLLGKNGRFDGYYHGAYNGLDRDERVVFFASDREATIDDFPGYRLVEIRASDPGHPTVLGRPGEGVFIGYVTRSGAAYALTLPKDDTCGGWAVARMGYGSSEVVACANTVPDVVEGARPQRLFVSEDESVIAFSYHDLSSDRPPLQHIAVFSPATPGSEPEIIAHVTEMVHDLHYSRTTGELYFLGTTSRTIFSITPGSGQAVPLIDHYLRGLEGAPLLLIGDELVAIRRDERQTTLYSHHVVTGAERSLVLPWSLGSAYEHDGYLMLRTFEHRGQEKSFIGFCWSSPEEVDVFELPLPAFAQETALFTHTLSCP